MASSNAFFLEVIARAEVCHFLDVRILLAGGPRSLFATRIVFAAVNDAVMIANWPLLPRIRGGVVHQGPTDPLRGGLVDEEVAARRFRRRRPR